MKTLVPGGDGDDVRVPIAPLAQPDVDTDDVDQVDPAGILGGDSEPPDGRSGLEVEPPAELGLALAMQPCPDPHHHGENLGTGGVAGDSGTLPGGRGPGPARSAKPGRTLRSEGEHQGSSHAGHLVFFVLKQNKTCFNISLR